MYRTDYVMTEEHAAKEDALTVNKCTVSQLLIQQCLFDINVRYQWPVLSQPADTTDAFFVYSLSCSVLIVNGCLVLLALKDNFIFAN